MGFRINIRIPMESCDFLTHLEICCSGQIFCLLCLFHENFNPVVFFWKLKNFLAKLQKSLKLHLHLNLAIFYIQIPYNLGLGEQRNQWESNFPIFLHSNKERFVGPLLSTSQDSWPYGNEGQVSLPHRVHFLLGRQASKQEVNLSKLTKL